MIKIPPATEAREQIKVVQYLKAQFPNVLFRVGMEGGRRHPGLAKALGIGSGWPDIHIMEERCGYKSLFVELKREGVRLFNKLGQPADKRISNQLELSKRLNDKGHRAVFAFGANEAISIIEGYLNGREL